MHRSSNTGQHRLDHQAARDRPSLAQQQGADTPAAGGTDLLMHKRVGVNATGFIRPLPAQACPVPARACRHKGCHPYQPAAWTAASAPCHLQTHSTEWLLCSLHPWTAAASVAAVRQSSGQLVHWCRLGVRNAELAGRCSAATPHKERVLRSKGLCRAYACAACSPSSGAPAG